MGVVAFRQENWLFVGRVCNSASQTSHCWLPKKNRSRLGSISTLDTIHSQWFARFSSPTLHRRNKVAAACVASDFHRSHLLLAIRCPIPDALSVVAPPQWWCQCFILARCCIEEEPDKAQANYDVCELISLLARKLNLPPAHVELYSQLPAAPRIRSLTLCRLLPRLDAEHARLIDWLKDTHFLDVYFAFMRPHCALRFTEISFLIFFSVQSWEIM